MIMGKNETTEREDGETGGGEKREVSKVITLPKLYF